MSVDREREEVIETTTDEAGRKGGMVSAGTYPGYVAGYGRTAATPAEAGEAAYLGFSRANWGAVWAGFFVGAMLSVLFSSLGAAIGLSLMSGTSVNPSTFGTAAGIWMIVTSIISLFLAGLVAGRMASLPGKATGAMNGFLCGCVTLLLLSALALSPALANLPTLFSFMGARTQAAMPNVQIGAAQAAAWWTFIGLVLALGAAALGGALGARPAVVDPMSTGEQSYRADAR
ncbi:MAG TPA: hypothetical protein VFU47_11440 [Armatimonadota bacterium]|nr:hypothetical protein [Armatimonadota bacterium]